MRARSKSVVCIVTPGTAAANNGNWRTAARWKSLLGGECRVILQSDWRGERADALIALHAKHSAPAVRRWCDAGFGDRLAVMLTGTDLYRDLPHDADAVASLDAAARIVCLQEAALASLQPRWRRKGETIFQSAPALAPADKPRGVLRVVAVGHLRAEKDPRTVLGIFEHLPAGFPIRVRHIGAPLDARLAREARALMRRESRYSYSGALGHGLTREALRRAHVLVHPSRMEGGANVIAEAVMAGTPVIASRIAGNVGMLGGEYPGYFEIGDASALAAHLVQLLTSQAVRKGLESAARKRMPFFRPERERRAVRALVTRLLSGER